MRGAGLVVGNQFLKPIKSWCILLRILSICEFYYVAYRVSHPEIVSSRHPK